MIAIKDDNYTLRPELCIGKTLTKNDLARHSGAPVSPSTWKEEAEAC